MPTALDDIATLAHRFIQDYGPVGAAAVAAALGRDARQWATRWPGCSTCSRSRWRA